MNLGILIGEENKRILYKKKQVNWENPSPNQQPAAGLAGNLDIKFHGSRLMQQSCAKPFNSDQWMEIIPKN